MFKKFNRKTKELKQKDGYDRFKFMGRIFYYKEDEIKEINQDFSGQSVIYGQTNAFDNEGFDYTVEFVFNKKWIPFNISQMNRFDY